MRPLILGPEAQARIDVVMQYADAHRLTVRDLLRILAHPEEAAGNNPSRVVIVPFGYRCVFSIDETQTGKWVRHLSVSVSTPNKWPNELAVMELAKRFGFLLIQEKMQIDLEKEVWAVNIMQPLDEKGESN